MSDTDCGDGCCDCDCGDSGCDCDCGDGSGECCTPSTTPYAHNTDMCCLCCISSFDGPVQKQTPAAPPPPVVAQQPRAQPPRAQPPGDHPYDQPGAEFAPSAPIEEQERLLKERVINASAPPSYEEAMSSKPVPGTAV